MRFPEYVPAPSPADLIHCNAFRLPARLKGSQVDGQVRTVLRSAGLSHQVIDNDRWLAIFHEMTEQLTG
jgi:hypothetical protein